MGDGDSSLPKFGDPVDGRRGESIDGLRESTDGRLGIGDDPVI